ncbi:alpha/beta fold hydrolase [Corynebacterium flavescens]
MALRKHTRVLSGLGAVGRSWGERLRPGTRAASRTITANLHDHRTEPGLTQLSATGFVDNEGVRIAWFEAGPESAEQTVLFIHGYSLSSESFYAQVAHVRARFPQARCLLVDVRGHGQSAPVAPEQCTVEAAADDVLAVVSQRLPTGRIVVVGHSLGGMVALNLIRRAPQELYERIDSALLLATSMRRFAAKGVAQVLQSRTLRAVYRACLRKPRRADGIRYELARLAVPALAVALEGFPQMEKLRFHGAMLLDTPLSSYTGFFDDLLEHSEYAATARLQGVSGAILVGSLDVVTPLSQSEVIAHKWPAAALHEVEGAGHMLILEEPEAVNEALDLLIGAAGG